MTQGSEAAPRPLTAMTTPAWRARGCCSMSKAERDGEPGGQAESKEDRHDGDTSLSCVESASMPVRATVATQGGSPEQRLPQLFAGERHSPRGRR